MAIAAAVLLGGSTSSPAQAAPVAVIAAPAPGATAGTGLVHRAVAVVAAVATRARTAAVAVIDAGEPSSFIWPAKGPIWSPFGRRGGRNHDGVDIGAPNGSPIVAAQRGTVISVGWENGYGNTVVVDHGRGISTLYAHQSRTAVKLGAALAQGQVLGYVGTTGRVTAPHLHYEVHLNGVPRDPMPWL